MSKFQRKTKAHSSQYRNMEAELEIIPAEPEPAIQESPVPLWSLLFPETVNIALLDISILQLA
jgi:hypothetical protein